MFYGLKTLNGDIVFKSRYLQETLNEMKKRNDVFIVEIEEKQKPKRDYSREFVQ